MAVAKKKATKKSAKKVAKKPVKKAASKKKVTKKATRVAKVLPLPKPAETKDVAPEVVKTIATKVGSTTVAVDENGMVTVLGSSASVSHDSRS